MRIEMNLEQMGAVTSRMLGERDKPDGGIVLVKSQLLPAITVYRFDSDE